MRSIGQAVKSYVAATNADPKPFVWTRTADEILASVARYCQRTTPSHHWHYLATSRRSFSVLAPVYARRLGRRAAGVEEGAKVGSAAWEREF